MSDVGETERTVAEKWSAQGVMDWYEIQNNGRMTDWKGWTWYIQQAIDETAATQPAAGVGGDGWRQKIHEIATKALNGDGGAPHHDALCQILYLTDTATPPANAGGGERAKPTDPQELAKQFRLFCKDWGDVDLCPEIVAELEEMLSEVAEAEYNRGTEETELPAAPALNEDEVWNEAIQAARLCSIPRVYGRSPTIQDLRNAIDGLKRARPTDGGK